MLAAVPCFMMGRSLKPRMIICPPSRMCAPSTVRSSSFACETSLRSRNDTALPGQEQFDLLKESLTMSQGFDLTDRRDVACLVNVFYDRVRDDGLLGPIFDDVAHVDWATHLPRM